MASFHYFLSLALVAVVAQGFPEPHLRQRRNDFSNLDKQNGNKYIDEVMDKVKKHIEAENLNPYVTSDYSFINVHVNGEVHGFLNIEREGNATIYYNPIFKTVIAVESRFVIKNLTTKVNWRMNLPIKPIVSNASATVDEMHVKLQLRKNVEYNHLEVTDYEVVKVGHIKTEVHTPVPIPGYDYVLTMVSDASINLVKNVANKVFRGPYKVIVQKVLDTVDIPKIVE